MHDDKTKDLGLHGAGAYPATSTRLPISPLMARLKLGEAIPAMVSVALA